MIKQFIKAILPQYILNELSLLRSKEYLQILIHMINAAGVKQSAQDEDKEWYILFSDGVKLFGPGATQYEIQMYNKLKHKIPKSISKETFSIVKQAVTSYFYPHSMPALAMEFPLKQRELFGTRQADTIKDFSIDKDKMNEIVEIFTPKTGETFIEVGAYIGHSTVRHAKEQGEQSTIIAFEADKHNFAILKKNIEINKIQNVHLIQKAVGDKNGSLELHSIGRMGNTAFSEIINTPKETYSVEMVTIDSVLKEMGISHIDHVSITVNGFEPEVVLGMKNTIQSSNKIRVCAAGWYTRTGQKGCDLLKEYLKTFGMDVLVGNKGRVIAWKTDNK